MALSKREKNDLEDVALRALGKRLIALVNGFRVMGDIGQVAAVYWSDNMPSNDVEIALCDIRLSERYDLRIVRRWIEREQRLAGQECNVHKHGSDWPIVGFTYDGAIAFLDRCRRLRKGILDNELVNELTNFALELGERNEDLEIALAQLRPTSKKHVIDLVKLAGVDVERWYKTGGEKVVVNPRSNPAYCFNWSFGGNGEPVVACLWHGNLKIDTGKIVYADNLREHARKLQEIANTSGEEQETRNRAQTQARRAIALDAALAGAWASKGIVRVIVNEGLQRPADSLGKESSKVEMRKLDTVAWNVAEYDGLNGRLCLVRNDDVGQFNPSVVAPLAPSAIPAVSTPASRFADQYTVVAADVMRTESTASAYSRSRAVRDAALTRASGACELCGQKGFVTQSGSIYLETHHVQPLSESGADSEDNVVALCADDHRRAHYSTEAVKIRERLQAILAEMYSTEVDRAA
jgi:5-methylcytosine-specific restriction protein A